MTGPASDFSFNLSLDEESGKEGMSSDTIKSWSKAHKDFDKYVSDALKAIEREFRSLLGVKEEQND